MKKKHKLSNHTPCQRDSTHKAPNGTPCQGDSRHKTPYQRNSTDKTPNGTPYLRMMINFEDKFEKNKAFQNSQEQCKNDR